MADAPLSLSSPTPDLIKISSLADSNAPGQPIPMPVPVTDSELRPDTSQPNPGPQNRDENAVMANFPSTKRSMVRQSSASLVQSQQLSSSTDSLIDSLISPSTAPSPVKVGKAKAQDLPAASSLEAMPGSILLDYLQANPGKQESVDAAMRRTDTNLTILASKLDVAQATFSEDINALRAHLTQFASDYATPSNGHAALSELITSHNRVVDAVTDLKGLAGSLGVNNATLSQRLTSLESAVVALQQGPGLIPAEKRARYENIANSTLVPATTVTSINFEYPHIHSPFSSDATPSYPAHSGVPNAPAPIQALQNVATAHYTGHVAILNAPAPYSNAPTPYANTPAHIRSRALQIGPMNWTNPQDEVLTLMTMLPTLKSIKQNFSVGSTNNPHFVKVLFATPSDATSFVRAWSSSRPQQYKSVTAKYVPEN